MLSVVLRLAFISSPTVYSGVHYCLPTPLRSGPEPSPKRKAEAFVLEPPAFGRFRLPGAALQHAIEHARLRWLPLQAYLAISCLHVVPRFRSPRAPSGALPGLPRMCLDH